MSLYSGRPPARGNRTALRSVAHTGRRAASRAETARYSRHSYPGRAHDGQNKVRSWGIARTATSRAVARINGKALVRVIAPFSIPSPNYGWQGITIPLPWGGTLSIPTAAICILVGIAIAMIVTGRRLSKRDAEPGVVLDVTVWAVLFGLVGARLYFILTHTGDYLAGQSLWGLFRIADGGFTVYGALIGGVLGVWLGCRLSGLRLTTFLDAAAPGVLIAIGIGRIGNWFEHAMFGTPTDAPWGLVIESSNAAYPKGLPDGTLFQPVFLYELVWNVVGGLLILWLGRRFTLQWGRAFALLLIWFGLGQAYFETIRVDPSGTFLGFRNGVWVAYAITLIGLVLLTLQNRRHAGLEPGPYRPGQERDSGVTDKDAAGVDSDDTESDPAALDGIVDSETTADERPATSPSQPTAQG